MRIAIYLFFGNLFFFFSSLLCAQNPEKASLIFEKLPAKKTGIQFKNQLKEDAENNILRYEYFYNGGGVAVGDLDGDGLEELFFTGNMTGNKLYKNLGQLKFSNVTKSAGVAGKSSWTTGVSFADVNGDGLLDIYVCFSGKGDPDSRRNELWINEGNLKFSEQAQKFGIDDPSHSTQGLFFDFDRDGDLDLYLLNHNVEVINEIQFDEVRARRHPTAGDKLFRNDQGKFIDISEKAGIKGTGLGFGLSVISSDINGDDWPDLLVTNDYIEPDYLYINNQDGTFTDRLTDYLQHISHFSMGADIADLNQDGRPELFTLDMLPEDNERQKLLYGPENYEQYNLMVNRKFHHQLMRNMLHLNLGNGKFSEIAQVAGISNTDWSWSALFFDANNNGEKDLFVSNGYYRDYTNRDFLKYKGDYYFKKAVAKEKADTLHLVTSMSSTPIHDYLFENQGNIQFKNISTVAGFGDKLFSSGAAYVDLDRDGDLDLVVNHLNESAGIFENKSNSGNWLGIKLKGFEKNPFAVGAKVKIYFDGGIQFLEAQPTRGFQSSSSPILHFGLGKVNQVDSIQITWPDGFQEAFLATTINQILTLAYQTGKPVKPIQPTPTPWLLSKGTILEINPSQSKFNDFKRQPLLLTMPSHLGPILSQSDLNQDGIPELFIGGSKGHAAQIVTFTEGQWTSYRGFRSSADFTDAVAIFEDFNGDGFPDLFLGSGGYHDYTSSDPALKDRLYLNDGQGVLIPQGNFPNYAISTGSALALDLDGDEDLDLVIGGKIIPGRYPETPNSKVLINDGKGIFSDQTDSWLPSPKIGMVTALLEADVNEDSKPDILVFGEFMQPQVLVNSGSYLKLSTDYFESDLGGWWNTVQQVDIDQDGDLDLIAGNMGWNMQLKASPEKEVRLYAADFDQNGSIDPILECVIGEDRYPFPSRDELLDQMVSMRSKFTDYASYSTAKIQDLFSKEELEKAQLLKIQTFTSLIFENTPEGYKSRPLPLEAQYFPIYSIHSTDINQDGKMDLILGGNQNQSRIRIGKMDAGFGLVLLGDGTGNFNPLNPEDSGLSVFGDIKSFEELQVNGEKILVVGINQQPIQVYQFR